jgi:hypothetical protein
MAISIDRPMRRRLADGIEAIFGPDPGLVRLRTAARAVLSAIISVGIVVAIFGASLNSAPAFAAGFMISIFGNVAVRDDGTIAKLISLGLLAVTITVAMGITGWLATWPRLADLAVFAICVAASAVRNAGPRWMAVGMIAFMGSFIGDFLHTKPAILPIVLAAGTIGAAVAAIMRLVVMRDDPETLLAHVRRHLDRRISRILGAVRELIAQSGADDRPKVDEAIEARINRELGRLNDAFLVAQNELNDIEQLPDDRSHLSWDKFFALELAAERLVRVSAHFGGAKDREQACRTLDALNDALVGNAPLPPRLDDAQGPLLRSLDALIAALHRDQPSPAMAPAETEALDR